MIFECSRISSTQSVLVLKWVGSFLVRSAWRFFRNLPHYSESKTSAVEQMLFIWTKTLCSTELFFACRKYWIMLKRFLYMRANAAIKFSIVGIMVMVFSSCHVLISFLQIWFLFLNIFRRKFFSERKIFNSVVGVFIPFPEIAHDAQRSGVQTWCLV